MILEKIENKFMFSQIVVEPRILVSSNSETQKVKNLIEFSKQHCLISNSIKSEVILEANVEVRDG